MLLVRIIRNIFLPKEIFLRLRGFTKSWTAIEFNYAIFQTRSLVLKSTSASVVYQN